MGGFWSRNRYEFDQQLILDQDNLDEQRRHRLEATRQAHLHALQIRQGDLLREQYLKYGPGAVSASRSRKSGSAVPVPVAVPVSAMYSPAAGMSSYNLGGMYATPAEWGRIQMLRKRFGG